MSSMITAQNFRVSIKLSLNYGISGTRFLLLNTFWRRGNFNLWKEYRMDDAAKDQVPSVDDRS